MKESRWKSARAVSPAAARRRVWAPSPPVAAVLTVGRNFWAAGPAPASARFAPARRWPPPGSPKRDSTATPQLRPSDSPCRAPPYLGPDVSYEPAVAISRPTSQQCELSLSVRFSILCVFVLANQNFALSGVVGLADDALLLHPLHDRGGAIVADLQPALDVAGRGLLVAGHDLDRLLVEIGGVAGRAHARRIEDRVAVIVDFLLGRRDGFEVLRLALRFQVPDDLFDLVVGA